MFVYKKIMENILYLHRQAKILCFKHQKVPFLWMELWVNNVHFITFSCDCFKLLERKLALYQTNPPNSPKTSLNQLNLLEPPGEEETTENTSMLQTD